jgi:NADH dehydrogenase
MSKSTVVIVGAGFAGLTAAKTLSKNPKIDVLLFDRRNFHLFQPLLYQVAMAGLNPSDIAMPLRPMFRGKKNVRITLAEVKGIDFKNNEIIWDDNRTKYDYLILACGSKHSYFGNEKWEQYAPGLKNIEQALEIRRRVLLAFEQADKASDIAKTKSLLTFAIVGGGPTGVEIAGAIAEMLKKTFHLDYQTSKLAYAKVILVESGSRILSQFPESLSIKAKRDLEKLGVDVRVNALASQITAEGLSLGSDYVRCSTIIWAAGVVPSKLSHQIDVAKDRSGRILVNQDLSVPGFSNVFVLGDQAAFATENDQLLPGLAPVAVQQGAFVATVVEADRTGQLRPFFKYRDKGIMATIGRRRAVVYSNGLKLEGFIAWLAWALVHIIFLVSFKSRVLVLLNWILAYFTFGRSARIITHKTWKFFNGERIDI